MSKIEKLKTLNLDRETMVSLSYHEPGHDVLVCMQNETETALNQSDIPEQLAKLITTEGLNTTTASGDSHLEVMRTKGLLDAYNQDVSTLESYIKDVLLDHANFDDHAFIDYNIDAFDHRDGQCDLIANIQIPLGELIDVSPELSWSWDVSVPMADGTLTL